MEIVWDEPKRLANLDKHGLDFATLDPAFFLDAVVLPAKEGRLKAVREFDGQIVTVIFKPVGSQGVSIISFRLAGRNERKVAS